MDNNEDVDSETSTDNDDSEVSEDDVDDQVHSVQRRDVRSRVQPTSSSGYRNLSTNPYFGNRTRLWSKTRHYLGVYPDGAVRGTEDKSDLHTHLELISASFPGHLWIKGLLTNMFVAMNNKGRIYAAATKSDENTVFIEGVVGQSQTYLSRQHAAQGWYLGIKKSGKMKNGKATKMKQKAVQFFKVRRGVS